MVLPDVCSFLLLSPPILTAGRDGHGHLRGQSCPTNSGSSWKTSGALIVTVVVTIQGSARALKHARAPSRPGNNGGAQVGSMEALQDLDFSSNARLPGSAFAAFCGVVVARLGGAFGGPLRRLCGILRRLCRAFAASLHVAALGQRFALRHLCGVFVARLCRAFAAPLPRFCFHSKGSQPVVFSTNLVCI